MVYFTTRNDRSLSNPNNLWKTWDNFAHQFDSFFTDYERAAVNPQAQQEQTMTSAPATDVEESESHYDLSFDMPGLKKDDINIEVNGRTLLVTGKRERAVTETKLHRSEKFFGEYRRTISLPEGIKADDIEASYDNGVLSLRLPKAQVQGVKKIQVGSTFKTDKNLDQNVAH